MRLIVLSVLLGLTALGLSAYFHATSPLSRASQPVAVEHIPDKRQRNETVPGKNGTAPGRHEIVFVIDTTKSMKDALPPVAEAVSDFIASAQVSLLATKNRGPIHPLRTGLLFYRDKKIGGECELDYLTKWRVELTEKSGQETLNQTIASLKSENAAKCGSDEEEEAVFDALNRAILDPKWQDGSDRLIMLIGDAGPHPPTDTNKNPLALDRALIQKLADERNVRILAVELKHDPFQDTHEFELLATDRQEKLRGRFFGVLSDSEAMSESLPRILWQEWER